MDLRCKCFRATQAAELERSLNQFLDAELPDGEAQLEEITQSEGPDGVTVVVWYSIGHLAGALEGPEEVDDELDVHEVPRDLA
jgi:hypothetical protein